jgi:hypothetical protein
LIGFIRNLSERVATDAGGLCLAKVGPARDLSQSQVHILSMVPEDKRSLLLPFQNQPLPLIKSFTTRSMTIDELSVHLKHLIDTYLHDSVTQQQLLSLVARDDVPVKHILAEITLSVWCNRC